MLLDDTTSGGERGVTGAFSETDLNMGISAGFTINVPVDLNNPITVNITDLVKDAIDNGDGFLRLMLHKENDNNVSGLGAIQFYGWCGRENSNGRQDFEPDLFVHNRVD